MPAIGQLRQRIELQSATDAADAYGQATRTWATYATVWAQVLPAGGGEPVVGDQQQQTTTHKITIRYRAGVEATHRALLGSRVLNFASVRNWEERERWLEIDATEMA